MSTTTTAPEGQSPVVAAPAATPAPAPVDIKSIDLSKLAGNGLLAEALSIASSQPEGETPAAPDAYAVPDETPAPAAVVAAKPAETPAAPAPEDTDPQPEKLGKFRVSARDFKEAEFLRLAKSMPVPEAYAKAYGTAQPAAPVAAATPAAQPEAAPVAAVEAPELAAAKSTLAELEGQLTKAQEDADLGSVTKLMREIGKAERAVERMEQQAEAQRLASEQAVATEAQTTFQRQEDAVRQEVRTRYPQLGDQASLAEFQQFVDLKHGDPLYAGIFESPLRFRVLAGEFAEAKGWNKAVAPAPAAGIPAPTPGASAAPRVTSAEVLTPGSTQGGSGAIDGKSALATLRAQGPEALFKALNSVSR
jgi:hypothetical protein